jgi:hypothetical protein
VRRWVPAGGRRWAAADGRRAGRGAASRSRARRRPAPAADRPGAPRPAAGGFPGPAGQRRVRDAGAWRTSRRRIPGCQDAARRAATPVRTPAPPAPRAPAPRRVSSARPRPPPSASPSAREAVPRRAARTRGPRPCRATPARLPCSVCTPAGARRSAPRPRGRARTAPRRRRVHPTRVLAELLTGVDGLAHGRPPSVGSATSSRSRRSRRMAASMRVFTVPSGVLRALRDLRLRVAGVVGQHDRFALRWRQRGQRRAYPFAAQPRPGRVLDRRQIARAGRGVVVRLLGQAGPPRAQPTAPGVPRRRPCGGSPRATSSGTRRAAGRTWPGPAIGPGRPLGPPPRRTRRPGDPPGQRERRPHVPVVERFERPLSPSVRRRTSMPSETSASGGSAGRPLHDGALHDKSSRHGANRFANRCLRRRHLTDPGLTGVADAVTRGKKSCTGERMNGRVSEVRTAVTLVARDAAC